MECYFAYGSNMNPARVEARGLRVLRVEAAWLPGFRLAFDKHSAAHQGAGHANIAFDRNGLVEGVLYRLADTDEIAKMDRFESAPVNYSREAMVVRTAAGKVASWTYVANPAVLRPGLKPPRSYLNHLLAGEPYLSRAYFRTLAGWECLEDR